MQDKYISPEETLTEIRHMMERSSRFISLSGFSGVFAGIYALVGAVVAYYHLQGEAFTGQPDTSAQGDTLTFLITDALIVLVLAVGTGIFLTTRKAKKDGNSILDAAAKKLLINLAIPLVAGGIFCIALILREDWHYLAPSMLIFYGLALLHASKYTRDVVRSLGIAQIVLGLITLFFPERGLFFWAFGFGVLHILYGIYMYLKYEK